MSLEWCDDDHRERAVPMLGSLTLESSLDIEVDTFISLGI